MTAEAATVQIAMIGRGRMGANMVRRLIRKGHNCVVFERHLEKSEDKPKVA